jgi:hypothetical protein
MKNMLIYAKIIVDYSKTLFNHGKKLIRSTNNYKDTKQKLQQQKNNLLSTSAVETKLYTLI